MLIRLIRSHGSADWPVSLLFACKNNQVNCQGAHVLRSEFHLWKVHGIMNTSGLLKSK